MARIQTLFLLLIVIGPLHMGEQILTSIEEFYAIRGLLASYYLWFDPAFADRATVMLITFVWTMGSLLMYALLREGTLRLAVLGMIGVFSALELHHIVEWLVTGIYDPGAITCIPYSIVGGMLVTAVWREYQRSRDRLAAAPSTGTVAA